MSQGEVSSLVILHCVTG